MDLAETMEGIPEVELTSLGGEGDKETKDINEISSIGDL